MTRPTITATPEPVIEFASFRLTEGVDTDAFLDAAKATESLLRERGTVINRSLTVDDDGLWTDVVQWRSMEDAKTAAVELMAAPEFQPFMQLIDVETATMRHASIQWQMT